MEEINLDSWMSEEKRQELVKLKPGDEMTINGKKYTVEKRFSKGQRQAATLVPA